MKAADAAARTRTWDNLVNSEVLYHLSYGGSAVATVYLGKSVSLHRRPIPGRDTDTLSASHSQ
jgi:hypothetical protein